MDGERLPEFGKSIHRRCGEGFPGCRKCPRPREWAATVLTAGTSSGPTLLPSPAGCSAGSADSHGSEHPPIAVGHANGLPYGHQPRERIPFPSEWERRSIFVAIRRRRPRRGTGRNSHTSQATEMDRQSFCRPRRGLPFPVLSAAGFEGRHLCWPPEWAAAAATPSAGMDRRVISPTKGGGLPPFAVDGGSGMPPSRPAT